jgi:hypothetical protein
MSPEHVRLFLEALDVWVEKERPSLSDIARRMDAEQ